MGNCHNEYVSELELNTTQLSTYKLQYVIGRGGFGRVWRIQQFKTNQLYALKEMSKAKIIKKQSIQSVLNERKLLEKLHHELIVNMKCAFQTQQNLYIVMDLMEGGDLRYHLFRSKTFSEEQTKFFVICIVLALQHLHNNLVLHRDIKPENLVFSSNGYLKLTDFGISRIWRPDNQKDTSGTPGYMAPEVLFRQNHGVASDYFSLGVVAYECITGRRPFQGKSRKEIREHLLAQSVKLLKTPEISQDCVDFINKLIERKPKLRLGNDGPDDLMKHKWMKGVDWDKYTMQQIQSPYVISKGDHFDETFVNKQTEENYTKINVTQDDFIGFTYGEESRQLTDCNTTKQCQTSARTKQF